MPRFGGGLRFGWGSGGSDGGPEVRVGVPRFGGGLGARMEVQRCSWGSGGSGGGLEMQMGFWGFGWGS